MNLDFDISSYLWYIIPGSIIATPLIYKNPYNIGWLPKEVGVVILISFIIGFLSHSLYRLIYNLTLHPTWWGFKKFIKEHLLEDLSGFETDNIYNYFIYTSNFYKTKTESIRKESIILSSVGTIILSIILLKRLVLQGLPLSYYYTFISILVISWVYIYLKIENYQKFLFSAILSSNNNQYTRDRISNIITEKY